MFPFLEQFKFYVMGGLAILVLLLSGALAIEHYRLAAAKSEINSLTTQLGACQDANASNQVTIANLKAANSDWAAKCSKPGPQAEHAAADITNLATNLTNQAATQQQQRELIYANDKAARDWAHAPLPPAIAQRLRASSGG